MFVGHALLAFAAVASVARWRGWEPTRAIHAGVLAGLFATTPDLDILYGPVGLLGGASGLAEAAETFWATGNVVHRGPTHSMVIGAVAAVAFACWSRATGGSRVFSVAVVASLVATVAVVSGLLGALVTALFLTGGLVVTSLARRHLDLSPRTVGLAALVGLVSHPLGDLFTGSPPSMLYPFDVSFVDERIALHPDPTLDLLGAFAVELAVIWIAILVTLSLTGLSLWDHVDRRAALGVAYGGAALALPAPTLETSYHFVFSVLAFGAVAVPRRRFRRVDSLRIVCTALAVVTFAGFAYGVAYVLV